MPIGHYRKGMIAGLGVIALFGQAGLARAQAGASAAPSAAGNDDQTAIFSLKVNGVDQGEALATLRGDDVFIARKDLEAAGLRGIVGDEVDVGGKRLLSLGSVRPRLRFHVDEETITLAIDAPLEALPAHAIDLSTAPADVSYAKRSSVFLNYAPSATMASTGPASASFFGESGVSENGRLWYSSVFASTTNGVARGLTNLTLDDRPKLVRVTLGDSNVSTGAIGSAAILGGVTVARDFTLNPYFIRFPAMRFAASTLVPARVDVYVNGIRVKSEAVDPGTFTLDNVRGLVGAGNVRYVIHDALGRDQSFTMPYYVGPTVLAKGLDDYAFSVGLPRNGLGVESFGYAPPALLSYYRRGLSDAITAGARAEARATRISGGPSLSTATPAGLFEVELAGSVTTDERTGLAGIFSYQFLSPHFNAGASFRALSAHYATAILAPDDDRSLEQASAYVSVPVAHRATLASEIAVDVHRDLPTFARVSTFSQVSLTRDLSLVGEVALVTQAPPRANVDGFLTFVWSPDSDFHVNAGGTRTNGVNGANLQIVKSSTFGQDWAMSGAVQASEETTEVSVNHRLQTASNIVSTYFDWHPDGGTLSVEPAGGVVWVAGSPEIFLTRPLYDSFALVRVPGVKNVRVYLNAQEVGRTNARGDLLVPSLISYYGSQLKIASEDVPLQYTLDAEAMTAAPPRRGAAYVEFTATRVRYFRGRVRVTRNGVEQIPAYGDLAVMNRGAEISSPIGEDGSFELEGLTPGTHTAEVRHAKGLCRFTFDVQASEIMLVELGVVRCVAPLDTPPPAK